jgi:hypothetical protein
VKNAPAQHPAKRRGKQSTLIFLVLLGLGLTAGGLVGFPDGAPSADAIVRAGISSDLLAGLPEGRQALVGSLRWGPLPTMLQMPFVRLPGLALGPFAMVIVAAGSYALLGAFLNSWWAARGLGIGVRLPAILALYLSPWVRNQILSGSSTSVFVLLLVLTVCFFLDWWETDELRSLAYVSLMTGLGFITQYQFILVFLGLLGAIFVHMIYKRRTEDRWKYVEGTLFLYAAPTLYLVALWVAANWLIMGEPGFFLRGLPHTLKPMKWLALLGETQDWAACVMPLSIALAGWLGAYVFAGVRVAAGLPAMSLALFALVLPSPPADTGVARAQKLAVHLEAIGPNSRVIVSGYTGYTVRYVASPHVRNMIEHTLSLYMDQALLRTRGNRLYIAVPPHSPVYRWEDIHLKYPRIYSAYHPFVVYERNMDDWRLLGVTRTD